MTATDWDQTTNHDTDYEAPVSLGSGAGASSSRGTRTRKTEPEYIRSVFKDADVRRLVAAVCEDQIVLFQQELKTANRYTKEGLTSLIRQLDSVVNELTPEKKG